MTLEQIEKRFCETAKLEMDLTVFPIKKEDYKEQKQETIKELSKKYGFVPTPIFLVDTMICMEMKNLKATSTTCDFCAGVGQYSIRLLRYLYNKYQIDVDDFLKNNHYITELQAENCAALVYTFGPNINLYVGDSMNLKYSDEKDRGILFFDEKNKKWFNDKVIDALLTKSDIATNREFLSYLFNNYKDKQKVIEYVNKIKNGEFNKPKEDVKVEAKEIVINTVLNDDNIKDESKSVQKQNQEKSPSSKSKENRSKENQKYICNKCGIEVQNSNQLKDGLCKECRAPHCKDCGKNISQQTIKDGLCSNCRKMYCKECGEKSDKLIKGICLKCEAKHKEEENRKLKQQADEMFGFAPLKVS